MAAEQIDAMDIPAEVLPGGKDDALWYAMGANKAHGLPMKRGDVKRAVELAVKTWPNKSQQEIAEQVGCSQSYVAGLKRAIITSDNGSIPPTRVNSRGESRPTSYATRKPTTPEEEEAAAQNGGRSTGFPWPLPPPRCTRRPARAHAPVIVLPPPPHSPPLAARPPLCAEGRTAGGGRRAPHTATAPGSRLPASGPPGVRLPASRPSQTTAPRRRGPRLPGEHSPGDSPSPAILQPRRPIRHDLLDPPPSFQVLSPNPSLPAYGDPAPKLAGLISSPVRTHIGERPRKEGGGRRFIHVHSFAAPKRGQEVGQIRTAADRGRMLPASFRPLRTNSRAKRRFAFDEQTHRLLAQGCAGPTVAGACARLRQAPPSPFTPSRSARFAHPDSQDAPPPRPLAVGDSPCPRAADGPRRAVRPRHPTAMNA